MAERVGFEPTVPRGHTRSPGVHLRPLGHLSACADTKGEEKTPKAAFSCRNPPALLWLLREIWLRAVSAQHTSIESELPFLL